jgi:oxygen-independent coproporphyrinogen-3 oxidase
MLGLYLHIPFCEKKCSYCDFNTYAGLEAYFSETVDALCTEMGRWREPMQQRRFDTVFVGGGTPTILDDIRLAQLFAAIHENFSFTPQAEITCEANPGTVDRAKFHLLRTLGVNRLSLGVQSFRPEELRFLGRIHSVDDVQLAFHAARAAGFANINLDFIFGLPGQSLSQWCKTVEEALALQPEHLSLYSLIVEPNTPLHHWVRSGQTPAPDEDQAALCYEYAIEHLSRAGCIQYEISNWARATPNDKPGAIPLYASRHNLLYWQNYEYLGIGPGAHSHLRLLADGGWGERRWGNRKPVPGYVKRIQRGDSVVEFSEEIDIKLAMGETMMLGLRLVQTGVAYDHFYALHGVDPRTIFAPELEQLAERGLLTCDATAIRLTSAGRMLGNQVFAQFLPDAS